MKPKEASAAEVIAAQVGNPDEMIPAEVLNNAGEELGELNDEYDDDEDNATAPSPELSIGASVPQGDDDEMVETYVYDGEKDDYVKRLVPARSLTDVTSNEREHDGLSISDDYRRGEGADFDYRWIPADEKRALTDRTHGFVPVRKLLDKRYRLEKGTVRNGDLVLARRPKQVTEQRAKVQGDLQARLSGEMDALRAAAIKRGGNVEGDLNVDGEELSANDQRAEIHERLNRERTGKRTFAIPPLPFQRDKVAERHRAAVGG